MKPNTPCKFNESRPKSYLDWVEYFSKQLPSPNKYRVGGKTRWNCSPEVASGGRFTSSARPSSIDAIGYLFTQSFQKETKSEDFLKIIS